jgi:hypothetical protein
MSLYTLSQLLIRIGNAIEEERGHQDRLEYLEEELEDAQETIDEQNADNLVGRKNYEELARYNRGLELARSEYGLRLHQLGMHVGLSPEIQEAILQLPADFRAYEYIPGPVGPPPGLADDYSPSQEGLAPEVAYNGPWRNETGNSA